jgi:hypothetical protein
MDKSSPEPVLAQLALAGKYYGIQNRIIELDVPDLSTSSDIAITGRFFYLTFKNKMPTLEEFVDYIYWRLIPFCIPRAKCDEYSQKYIITGDHRYHMELADQAKNLFIKSLNSIKRSGELGELVLFILIEAFMNAPQIACKMYLKTNENMPVHGSDSIHAIFDASSGQLELLWGESKIYQDISSSLDEICSSIKSFNDISSARPPHARDIDVLKDHVDISEPLMREAFLKYFDPYTRESTLVSESFCCFSGFEFSAYNSIMKKAPAEVEPTFKAEYSKRIKSAISLFESKLKKCCIEHLNFYFFLLPFSSVKDFRKAFFRKLGLSEDQIKKAME